MCPAICLAVRARHGTASGGKVRRHVREPLYGGCRRDRPGGGAEAARSGLRSRPDLQTRRSGIHQVRKTGFTQSRKAAKNSLRRTKRFGLLIFAFLCVLAALRETHFRTFPEIGRAR